MNQVADHYHVVEDIFIYIDETPNAAAGRVTGKERARGWGYSKFRTMPERQTQYLKDNTLHIHYVSQSVYLLLETVLHYGMLHKFGTSAYTSDYNPHLQ